MGQVSGHKEGREVLFTHLGTGRSLEAHKRFTCVKAGTGIRKSMWEGSVGYGFAQGPGDRHPCWGPLFVGKFPVLTQMTLVKTGEGERDSQRRLGWHLA